MLAYVLGIQQPHLPGGHYELLAYLALIVNVSSLQAKRRYEIDGKKTGTDGR